MKAKMLRSIAIGLGLVLGAGGLAACDKPKEEDCRKAIENIRRLMGTDKLSAASGANDIESSVRRCRGNSNKKSVQCAIAAQTVDDLKKCGLLPEDETPFGGKGSGSASGSASGSTGSASGSGSAGSASAAPGSASGTGSAK